MVVICAEQCFTVSSRDRVGVFRISAALSSTSSVYGAAPRVEMAVVAAFRSLMVRSRCLSVDLFIAP